MYLSRRSLTTTVGKQDIKMRERKKEGEEVCTALITSIGNLYAQVYKRT
jgi:hypothetical protein